MTKMIKITKKKYQKLQNYQNDKIYQNKQKLSKIKRS